MHRNEEDRLTETFESLRDRLLGSAYVLLGHREDAKEAVQEAFLKCWRRRHHLDGTRNPEGFIFTVLLNAARDMRRRRTIRRTEVLPGEDRMPATDRHASPPEAAARKDLVERIREALVALPDTEREVFLLRQNGGMTYAAIGRSLGAPEGTVKTRMRSALARLRTILDAGRP